jgi:SAM-dependent methyltransferase
LCLNLENIDLSDSSFDVIIANHVLEHVDDAAALTELKRVLTPKGRLLLTVPVIEGWDITYEDAAIVAPGDRAAHFGQWDHLRFYGRDIRQRISAAGFDLQEFVASGDEVVRFGLSRGERLFLALRC